MSDLLLSSSRVRPALCATLLVLGLASPAASQITINGAVPLTDYSAGSDRAPATIAPGFEREDSTTLAHLDQWSSDDGSPGDHT